MVLTSRHFIAYFATLLMFLVVDMVWLRLIAAQWYQREMAHLMAPSVNLVAGGLFYLVFPIGLMIFAVLPVSDIWRAAFLGGLFGLFAYATYDLTCLAVLKDWPVGLSVVDVLWGGLVSALAAGAGKWALSAA